MEKLDCVSRKLCGLGLKVIETHKPAKGAASTGFIIFMYGPFKYKVNWDVALYLSNIKDILKNSDVQPR